MEWWELDWGNAGNAVIQQSQNGRSRLCVLAIVVLLASPLNRMMVNFPWNLWKLLDVVVKTPWFPLKEQQNKTLQNQYKCCSCTPSSFDVLFKTFACSCILMWIFPMIVPWCFRDLSIQFPLTMFMIYPWLIHGISMDLPMDFCQSVTFQDHVVERWDTAKGLTPLCAAIEAAEAARWGRWGESIVTIGNSIFW